MLGKQKLDRLENHFSDCGSKGQKYKNTFVIPNCTSHDEQRSLKII